MNTDDSFIKRNRALWPQVQGMLEAQFRQWVETSALPFQVGRLDDGSTNSLLQDLICNNAGYRVDILLHHGSLAYLNYQNGHGNTALSLAVEQKRADMVAKLLAKGVAVDLPDALGRTPLHNAIRVNAPAELVKMLLDAGADPLLLDNQGQDAKEYVRTHSWFNNNFGESIDPDLLISMLESYILARSLDSAAAVEAIASQGQRPRF